MKNFKFKVNIDKIYDSNNLMIKFVRECNKKENEILREYFELVIKPKPKFVPDFIWKKLLNRIMYIRVRNVIGGKKMDKGIKDYKNDLTKEKSKEILRTLKTVDLIDLERRIDEIIDERNARVRKAAEELEKHDIGNTAEDALNYLKKYKENNA